MNWQWYISRQRAEISFICVDFTYKFLWKTEYTEPCQSQRHVSANLYSLATACRIGRAVKSERHCILILEELQTSTCGTSWSEIRFGASPATNGEIARLKLLSLQAEKAFCRQRVMLSQRRDSILDRRLRTFAAIPHTHTHTRTRTQCRQTMWHWLVKAFLDWTPILPRSIEVFQHP